MILDKIAREYSLGQIINHQILDGGIVNQTHLIETSKGKFVIQKLNKAFDERVIQDYLQLQAIFLNSEISIPTLNFTINGSPFIKDDDYIYRVFSYIENERITINPETAFEASRKLSLFHKILEDSPFKPKYFIPDFHNTKKIIEKLKQLPKTAEVIAHRSQIVENIEKHYLQENRKKSVIHGDPKFNNFLFRDGKVIAVIDLDTIMTESRLVDLGDLTRSWCKGIDSAFENEIFNAIVDGYCCSFNPSEILNAGCLITLELSARYLIDSVEQSYFEWDSKRFSSSREYNTEKCRNLLKYYSNMRMVRN